MLVKRILVYLVLLAGLVGISAYSRCAQAAIQDSNLDLSAEQGVMLHCFEWTFQQIEANLPAIQKAGFSSIQVSPVQPIRKPAKDEQTKDSPDGPWWLLYQPVSFQGIGNYKLGSGRDFKSLCRQARKRGITIIVDVVLNHIAHTGAGIESDSQLSPELRDRSLYHQNGNIRDYSSRRQVTQYDLYGLPDLKTQDQRVQDMHVEFLNYCINSGAGGFRFDAAKHIETNCGEDLSAWAGDYWEDVLSRLNKRENLYLVGEVRRGESDNIKCYLKLYDVTAHEYGGVLRKAVCNRNLEILSEHIDTLAGLPRDRCLGYVENHDDYKHGHSVQMSYEQRKRANVFLIARAGLTPRLLDRDEDDLWRDDDIRAINLFHNACIGKAEAIVIPDRHIAIVQRGLKGSDSG